MNLIKIENYVQYKELIDEYGPKKQYSNDYTQSEAADLIVHDRLFVGKTTSNLFLFVKKAIGYRIYYYIGNVDEIVDLSGIDDIVVEILYRGPKFYPNEEIEYLKKCGLVENLVRDQYCGVYPDLSISDSCPSVYIEAAKTLKAVEWACELFNSSFDKLSGDYIPPSSYEWLLHTGAILVAHDEKGCLLGALHQEIDKGVAWIAHVAVAPEARGRHVGQALLNEFIQSNRKIEKQRYMLWVQHDNVPAVSMYQKRGFKYLNKSTISLIKK